MSAEEKNQDFSGAILIDKPCGPSSFDVLRVFKKRFGIQKIGHSGTLDPQASGLLMVLLGEATRLQDLTMSTQKRYAGEIQLGRSTTTDDSEGEVSEIDHELFYQAKDPEELIAELQKQFSGEILQRPPAFSAIKLQGRKSYELAREGEFRELAARKVSIYELKLNFLGNTVLSYEVLCSKGFYVRSLARDIGEALGSKAHIRSLRRLSSGVFSVDQALPLEELASREFDSLPNISLEELISLSGIERIVLSSNEVDQLYQGKQQVLSEIPAVVGRVFALFGDDGYLGQAEGVSREEGIRLRIRYLRPRSLLKTEQVNELKN